VASDEAQSGVLGTANELSRVTGEFIQQAFGVTRMALLKAARHLADTQQDRVPLVN
jgi:hypothetical protein